MNPLDDKKLFFDMQEHPENYSDEQLEAMMAELDKEPDTEAAWQKTLSNSPLKGENQRSATAPPEPDRREEVEANSLPLREGWGGSFFSSMGAALRIDPTKVRVSEFWKIKGDPLAAAMRSSMRKHKLFPARKFLCVHSEEQPLPNLGKALQDGSKTFNKVQTNGSLAHITAIFGMTLAGLVIQDIYQQ